MVISTGSITKIIAVCLIAALLMPGTALGDANLNWINFTSMRDVRQMRLINDTVFIASSGGILAVADFDQPGRRYTNLDGLGTNDITDIIVDGAGQKWITGFGRLIRFDGDNSRQYLFFDLDDNLFRLSCAVDDGDNLWIGTDLGLVFFSKLIDDGQIQDSYQLFDSLNPSPEIYDILLEGDSIWLATSSGLAAADRTDPLLLKSPASWTGFGLGDYPELMTDTIINVTSLNTNIHVATRRGVYRMETGADTSFVEILIDGLDGILQMKMENDSLFVYWVDSAGGAFGVVSGDSVTRLSTAGLTTFPETGVGDGSVRWLATETAVFHDANGSFAEYPYLGMPGNDITDMVINAEGILHAGFRNIAMARLEDSVWMKYDAPLWAGTTDFTMDSSGRAWMGTAGSGLWVWNADTLAHYSDTNSSLIGIARWYGVVLGLAVEGDFLYAGSYRADNNYPVAIANLENLDNLAGWDSIGVDNGLSDIFVVDLDVHGRELTVATEQNGVYVCDVGNNPLNTNITCRQLTRQNSLLISNNTRKVRYSPDGGLWVGTTNGLSRYDRGIDFFVDVDLPPEVSSHIRSIEFDGRGNLWVGTEDGLVTVDVATGEQKVYNTLNSGIVGDVINSVTFDPFTGDFYIGTTSGFSLVPSRMGQPTSEVEQVVAFPNPFVIEGPDDRLNFNFGEEGNVRIFNIGGELVRQTTVATPWDGKNDKGVDVASGVYIFVITDLDGQVGKGKFLLVRQ